MLAGRFYNTERSALVSARRSTSWYSRPVTPFHLQKEFRGSREHYWRAFFDDACTREQYDLIGVRLFEIKELRDDGETLVRTMRVIPRRDFPAFMRKLFGTSLGFTETTTWYRSQDRAETRVTPDMMAGRIDIAGTHAVIDTPSGGLARVFSGQISIGIPVVGARIERMVHDDLAKSYAQSSEITQAWLDRWATGSGGSDAK